MVMQWTEARTLRDFGACTALWLEGKLPHMPTSIYCGDSINPETTRLVPLLAKLNRTGMLFTTQSQPACNAQHRAYGGAAEQQRAAVMGFVQRENIKVVVDRLRAYGDDLSLKVSPPGAKQARSTLLASRHKGRDLTRFGFVLSPRQIAEQFGGVSGWDDHPGLHPDVIVGLQQCYQICVVDQVWGRNSKLWPALQSLVR